MTYMKLKEQNQSYLLFESCYRNILIIILRTICSQFTAFKVPLCDISLFQWWCELWQCLSLWYPYPTLLSIILFELILMQSHPKHYSMHIITYPHLSLLPLHLILICHTLLPSLNFHHLTLHSLLNSLNITWTSLCRSHDILTIRIDNFDLPF